MTKRLLSGRPSYISQNNLYGIWWDGNGKWTLGPYANIDQFKLTVGLLYNRQDTSSPIHSEQWQEYSNNVWGANVNAHISCEGT